MTVTSAARGTWFALAAAALLLTGCVTSLQAPEPISDPRVVFVIDHGRHSSVAIETPSGNLVRYSYGDMRYYRDQDTSLRSGAAALLWPTPATLGRAELAGEATASSLQTQLVVGVQEILTLEVSGEKADALMEKLDSIHQEGVADHLVVPAYGLVFAPHPTDYIWWNNSSTVIAGWLAEMGVEVNGLGLIASWRVEVEG